MKRIVWAIAGATAVLLAEVPSSQALVGEAPWCAVVNAGTGEMHWDCQYQTVEQCAPNVVAGNRGFCNLNPYYQPAAAPPVRVKHYARRHAHSH
jgi:Protein of unknown function (DUF3551)